MTSPLPEIPQHRIQKSARYAALSQHKLQQAQAELDKGDPVQASEKAYGAVAGAAKACGELRGWNHYNHHRVYLVLEQLRDEWDAPELLMSHLAIKELHNNFFEHKLSPTTVQDGINVAQGMIARLEEIRTSEPRPLPASSLTREQRRRLTLLLQPPRQAEDNVEDLPDVAELPSLDATPL